jgi:hypothetical protein
LKKRQWLMVAAVVVFVACIGFFVKQYNDSGNPGSDNVGGVNPGSGASPSPGSSDSASSTANANAPGPFKGASLLPTGRPSTRDKFGNLIQPRAVTMTVTSSAKLFRVGYLVPTSLDSPYGNVNTSAHSWSLTVRATGKSPVAAVFIQAGGSGASVSCTISIDGQLGDSKTTTKAYERQLCLA